MTTANLVITDNETVIQYTSIGESIFIYDFPIVAEDELSVSIDQVDQLLGTHYTVQGVGDAGGGTITFLTATTIGELITIWQDMPIKRLSGFATGAAVLAGEALNTEFVRQVRQDQQLRREIGAALRLAPDDPQSGQEMIIPTQDTRAGKALAFDASGNPTVLSLVSNEDASLRADLASQSASLGFNLVAITKTDAEDLAGVTVVNAHWTEGHARRYGITIDGVTDENAAVVRWLKVGLQGVELIHPGGTILCSTWSAFSVTAPITMRGIGNGLSKIIGPDTSTNFLSTTSSIQAIGIEFDTFRAVVHVPTLSADIEFIDISRCRFTDVLYDIEKTRDAAELNVLKYLRFHRNHHDASGIAAGTFCSGVYYLGPYEKAEVTNNATLNVNGSAIHLGDTYFAMQEIMSDAIVSGNFCDGMAAPTGTEAHGVIVYGWRADISRNIVANLTTVDGSDGEGIYTKCRYRNVHHNLLIDACEGQGAINVKGNLRGAVASPQGFAGSVDHNIILFTTGVTTANGVNIENEDVEVCHNLIEGADRAIYSGSFELDHVSVHHNHILNNEGNQPLLFQHSGKDFRCEDNDIDGVICDNAVVAEAYGIRHAPHAAITGVKMNGNKVRIGAECNATTDCRAMVIDRNNAIHETDIIGNVLNTTDATVTQYGLRIEDTAASDRWTIKDNDWSAVDDNPFTVSGDLPTNLDFDNRFALQTTDATVTVLVIAQLPDNSAYSWEAKVVGIKSDASERAVYKDLGLFYRDGGNATQQGATANIITPIESDANWAFTMGVTSNSVRLRVTGVAATVINWRARVKILDAAA